MNEPAQTENIESEGEGDDSIEPMQDNVAQMTDHQPAGAPGTGPSLVSDSASLSMIMDIPVTVSMELGRTRLSIKELLSLSSGDVIELQRLASEPMEILVNGTLVAHGEAVRVGDRYGVRLTSVISASDRLKQVGG